MTVLITCEHPGRMRIAPAQIKKPLYFKEDFYMFQSMRAKIGKTFAKTKAMVVTATMAVMAMVVPVAANASPPPSSALTFSGNAIGIAPADVVTTGFNFMGLFDTWTMLVLGIIFAPVAIGFILWLFGKLPKLGKKAS